MKIYSYIKKKIKRLLTYLVILIVLFFQTNSLNLIALPMETYQSGLVIEELRLKVPQKFKKEWLMAEKKVWEPWLSTQEGFLGRQIFWDKGKEEALILVDWKNKNLWKSISMEEVNEIQAKFEEYVKLTLDLKENPFELIYEGELYKEK